MISSTHATESLTYTALSIGNPLSEELCSMFLPAFTSENKSLKQTVINAARYRVRL
jgi:hypothetical protein